MRGQLPAPPQAIVVDVNAIGTVFCAALPLNRVAEGDVIVYACVNGPREPVVVTSNEPAVPAGIGTLLLIVIGAPEVGVRVKLKLTEYVTEGLSSVPVNSREKLEHVTVPVAPVITFA